MKSIAKKLQIISLVMILFVVCLGVGISNGEQADKSFSDVPVITWKGTDYAPVLFTSNRECISEQLPGMNLLENRQYWLLRLQAVGDSAFSRPKETPFMECTLVTSDGKTIYPDNAFSSDETPPRTILLYSSWEAIDDPDIRLNMDGQVYFLAGVPDEITYSADLYTPGPTATPEPTPTPDPEVVRLQTLLEDFRSRNHNVLDELPALKGKAFIILFDQNDQPETSDEAAHTGTDFHGIPSEYLAPSADEANTVLMVFRDYKYIGAYSTGGAAYRVFTDIAVIQDTEEQLICVAVNDPPEKIRGEIGAGAAGEYEPDKAFDAILKNLAGD